MLELFHSSCYHLQADVNLYIKVALVVVVVLTGPFEKNKIVDSVEDRAIKSSRLLLRLR